LTNKLTPQRLWLLAIIAVVLVNALVWVYGLSPALDRIEAANNQLHMIEGQRKSLQQRLEQLNAIDTIALEAEMEHHSILIPRQGKLREIVTELESMANQLGLGLVEISISEPSILDSFLVTVLALELSGGYSAITEYLLSLEEHERLLFVDNLSLEVNESTGSLDCSMSIVIFAEDFDQITPYEAPGSDDPFVGR